MNDTPNAGSVSQVATAEEIAKRHLQRNADDVFFLLSSKEGRRFLGHLIYDPVSLLGGGCGVLQATFSQSHATMAGLEGARDVSLRLLAFCESVDLDKTLLIRVERAQQARIDADEKHSAMSKNTTEQEPDFPSYDGPVE